MGDKEEQAVAELAAQGYPIQLVQYAFRRSGGNIVAATDFVRSKVPDPTSLLKNKNNSDDEEVERNDDTDHKDRGDSGWWWGGADTGVQDTKYNETD